jgi:long-chain acyl-CoA synthetase
VNTLPVTMPGLVRRRAAEAPDHVALVVDGERPLTLAEWDERAAAAAARLGDLGLRPGDRVAVFPGPGAWIDLAVATLAVYLAGGVVVTVPPGLPPAEVRRRLGRCRVTGALSAGGPAEARGAGGAGGQGEAGGAPPPGWPWRWTAVLGRLGRAGGRPSAGLARPGDLAEILHTSGTTGRPKAVAITHANLAYGAGVPRPAPPSRTLCPFRIGTNAGHRALTMAMSSPSTIHVLTRNDPEHIAAQAARLGIDTVVLPPAALGHWPATRVPDRHDLSSLTALVLGSSPVPAAAVSRLSPAVPRASIMIGFGSTESAPASYYLPIPAWDDHRDPALFADLETAPLGRPAGATELMIAGPHGEPLPPGQVGEICLRSPAPRRFYYADPEATARTFRPDGWTRLGDLGYRDERGRPHFFDRSDHVLRRHGRQLSSSRLENALHWHHDVLEAAVVALPGDLLAAAAVTVPGSALRPDELLTFLATRLPPEDLPDRAQLLDELPRDGLGKIAKHRVRAQLTPG